MTTDTAYGLLAPRGAIPWPQQSPRDLEIQSEVEFPKNSNFVTSDGAEYEFGQRIMAENGQLELK